MSFLLRLVLLLTVVMGAAVATDAAEGGSGSRPNVLLIAIDDLNDWVAVLGGHPQVRTPNIDRLAARGVVFTDAHCQAPLCNPSRTSLITGRRPGTTGIYGLAPWFRTVPGLERVQTLPQAFAQAGYRTALAGKLFHSYPPPKDRAAEFQEYGPAATFGPFPEKKFVDTPSPHRLVDWGVFPATDEEQNDYHIATWGVEKLLTERDATSRPPFFYAVGFGRPHVPCYASQKWFDLYPEETLQMPPSLADDRDDTPRFSWYLHWKLPEPRTSWLVEAGQWKPLVRAYLASVSFVDAQVGRLLDALDESGKVENTFVVLFSDHGWHLGEKGITGKNSLWQRSTHVPLVIAGPGVANGRANAPVELLDIFPTLVDLAGVPAEPGLEGHSLRPQLTDPAAPRPWPAITTHNAGNNAVITSRWRYIRYADGSEELYDRQNDPNEWRNLAHETHHRAAKSELARWVPAYNAPPAPGSATRLLRYEDGVANWEGADISEVDEIPEF